MTTRIQLRRDTATNWTSNNPTLAEGEIGIELDTSKLKVGNGTTAWNDLDYISGSGGSGINGAIAPITYDSENQIVALDYGTGLTLDNTDYLTIDFGTTAGKVSEGDHNHSIAREMLPWKITYNDNINNPYNHSYFTEIKFLNNQWIVLGGRTNVGGVILTSDSILGPWTKTEIGFNIVDLHYENNLWVALSYDESSNIVILTSTELFGTWVENGLDVIWGQFNGCKLRFDGTYWGLLAYDGSLYTATDPAETWTLSATFPTQNYQLGFEYINNKWIVFFTRNPGGYGAIHSATDPTGSWTIEKGSTFETSISYELQNAPNPTLIPNYFTKIGWSPEGYFLDTGWAVVACPTLDGTWVKKIDFLDDGVGVLGQTNISTYYDDNRYVFVGRVGFEAYVATTTSLDLPYTRIDSANLVPVPDIYTYSNMLSTIFSEGKWVAVGECNTLGGTIWTSADFAIEAPLKLNDNTGILNLNYGSGLTVNNNALTLKTETKIPTFASNIYTLNISDASNMLLASNSSTAGTIKIPTNASVAFTIGTKIEIIQTGTGQLTISATSSETTTINSSGNITTAPQLRAQYSEATLLKTDIDTWYVYGDIV